MREHGEGWPPGNRDPRLGPACAGLEGCALVHRRRQAGRADVPRLVSKVNVQPGEFPFPLREGSEESRYLTWIRNRSDYMAVRGLLDHARAVGVLLRGILVNLLVFLPVLLAIAIAVAAYSHQDSRGYVTLALASVLALALIRGPGRGVSAVGWMAVLAGSVVPGFVLFLSYRYWSDGGFPLTATVLLSAVGWSLLFVVGTPLFRIRRYRRTVVTGSDSTVRARDAYERSFGAFVMLSLAVAAFESLAFFLPDFHHAVHHGGLGWPEVGTLGGVALAVLTAADKVLSLLGGRARGLAIAAFGLSGAIVPLLVVLIVADFLRFSRPLGGMLTMLLAAVLVPLGVLVALVCARRALSWRDRGWGLVLVAASLALTLSVAGVTVRTYKVEFGADPIADQLDEVAKELAERPADLKKVVDSLAVRNGSRVARLPPYLEDHWGEIEAAVTKAAERGTPGLLPYVKMLRGFGPDATGLAEQLVRGDPYLKQLISGVVECSDLHFLAQVRFLKGPLWSGDVGCRLENVRREVAAEASFSPRLVPEVYKAKPAREIRRIALQENVVRVLSLALLLGFIVWLTVDVNLTSIHGLYRDRLASAFLVGVDTEGYVDIEDDLDLFELCRHEAGSRAPYHLINAALNLHDSSDIGVRDRKSDYFIFSKRFVGGPRTGYCRSEALERVFPQMDLATAMAISSGAASPNMGRATQPALVAILTLLNIRLGYWLPNPGLLEERLAAGKAIPDKLPGFSFDDPAQDPTGEGRTVFGEELQQVQQRWKNLEGASRQLAYVNDDLAARPTVAHGLVGLAFSGGGIRSATLNLGIAQALHRSGVFDHVDYLSTVSGGGYLGSSISALMRHRTTSEVAGEVRVGGTADQPVLTVTPDAGGEPREYRYTGNARPAVPDGARVVPGQRLIKLEFAAEKSSPTHGEFFGWRVRPVALLREITGRLDEEWRWVNVSDGGHIENLATIELLRRRCKYIIVGDGEDDRKHQFDGLATLIRSARIDLRVDIDIQLDGLRLEPDGHTRSHWALGRVRYPGEEEPGYLLYLKASLTGTEDEVIRNYHQRSDNFPHESTADQSFTEGQFEAYRSLGQKIAEAALAHGPAAPRGGVYPRMSYTAVQDWFAALDERAARRSNKQRDGVPGLADEG